MHKGNDENAHWEIADLDFSKINIAQVKPDENLFYLVTCASFVESGSDLYTQNLVEYYGDEPEISTWLREQWEIEELQHGQALRAYVKHIWPEFDWQTAYRSFLDEYSTYCKVELLEPSKGLEMVARCVVEAGTATFYGALSRSTDEPVLQDLASRIAKDEVNHYKHFFHYFRHFRQQEGLRRHRIFDALCRRTLELKNEDAACSLRHVFNMRSPEHVGNKDRLQQISSKMNRTIRSHLSPDMAIKMIIRPLDLPRALQSLITYPATQIMNKVILR